MYSKSNITVLLIKGILLVPYYFIAN